MRIYTITQGEKTLHIDLDQLAAIEVHDTDWTGLYFPSVAINSVISRHSFGTKTEYLAAVNNLLTAWKGST